MSNSNGTIESSDLQLQVPVPDASNAGAESLPVLDHYQHRADSMSSMATSSVATSIIGDLSSDSVDDDDIEFTEPPSRTVMKETDRFGFKGGEQYTNPDEVILTVAKLRKREIKWLRMLDNWNVWMAKRFPEVKNRCRKGIPPSLRGRAWQRLSGSEFLLQKNPGVYENLLMKEADPNHLDDIEKDLHRQFPFHEMFEKRGGSGQQDLRNVLRAYTIHCPEVGYCQAQAPIVAVLLMHMPAEEAFWCMVAICDHYLPGYFSHGLEAVQIDGWVMQGLLKKVAPALHKHMTMHEVQPVLYMTEWFMCVFARTLPWPSVLRLWDMFFCEGVKIIFRCGLVLLRNMLGSTEKLRLVPGLYETVESLRKIESKYMQPNTLIFEIANLKITEQDLEREFKIQQKKHSESKAGITSESKRVYRYKPTHVNPKQTKSAKKKQAVNSLSADSVVIQNQVLDEKKKISDKKREKKSLKTTPKSSENSHPINSHEEEVLQNSSPEHKINQNDSSIKPETLTSFSSKSEPDNDSENHSQTSSVNQDTFL